MEEIDEEKMKEQLEEEMARYEEDGYFKRLFKMFAGLGKPRGSGEYKEAVIELQRKLVTDIVNAYKKFYHDNDDEGDSSPVGSE